MLCSVMERAVGQAYVGQSEDRAGELGDYIDISTRCKRSESSGDGHVVK